MKQFWQRLMEENSAKKRLIIGISVFAAVVSGVIFAAPKSDKISAFLASVPESVSIQKNSAPARGNNRPSGRVSPRVATPRPKVARLADYSARNFSASSGNAESVSSAPPIVSSSGMVSSALPVSASGGAKHLLVSEIMIGLDGASGYSFIEFYNPTADSADLTGWTVKKKTSTGSEISLIVPERLKGRIVQPEKYFLTANAGYAGAVAADVKWPSSYALAHANNAIEIFNSLGEKIEEVHWVSIPQNQSYERDSWSGNGFHLQSSPNPQNSRSR